ncbi:MAG: peptide chain release factor N(5)-glutamine methyltransferase [Chloroflexota bacterium]|nr:peptide chain release factor N(5)-glutamine methyltransferase [Chloroflexota bacterium]
MVLTVQAALVDARARLAAISESASSDGQALLGHVLRVNRAWLLTYPETMLTDEQALAYETLLARAAGGEPLPYVLGRWAFYDRDFLVTPAVLIPRPETELLLDAALTWVGDRALTVVDVGTGSGAIAVTLAALRPRACVYAIDVNTEALAVARQNAGRYQADVTFFEGDLLAPLIERSIQPDLVVANLPYIPSDEVDRLTVSRHEPRLALDGGADGLALIRRLIGQASHWTPLPTMLLEIMSGQGETVQKWAEDFLPGAQVTVGLDYAGHQRIVRLERRS